MTEAPVVHVVVPVHNRREITRAFLACLRAQTGVILQAVVVDDGSTDGTDAMIREQFPEVRSLRGDGSYFWTKATNVGLRNILPRARDDDFVLVINDDLLFEPGTVATLLREAQCHPGTIVGAVVTSVEAPDIVLDGGRRWNLWTAKLRFLNQGKSIQSFVGHSFDVSTLTGRGVLFPVTVFRTVGLYDDVGARHRGDTELPMRAAKAGFFLRVCYDAVVRNYPEKTFALDAKARYGIRDIRPYFFDFRSSSSIGFRWFLATRITSGPLQALSFFAWSMLRVSGRFVRRFRPT